MSLKEYQEKRLCGNTPEPDASEETYPGRCISINMYTGVLYEIGYKAFSLFK